MAAGPITQIADVVVPEVFIPYAQQQTEVKSRLIRSGAVATDATLNNLLAGGGLAFNSPSFQDLGDDADRVSTDTPHAEFTGGVAEPDPYKVQTSTEVQVRLSRNGSWSAADLATALAGADPMAAVAARVGEWRSRRLQDVFVATMKGVFADNDAAPTGTEHVQGDMTHDIKGASYIAGVTDFSTEAFIDASLTMGDSMDDLGLVQVHSVVYSRMLKNNLIDFVPDSEGLRPIAMFGNKMVIVDDSMPVSSGVYDTWIFGAGAVRLGQGNPEVPVEVERKAGAGNGGGQEVLYNRWEWALHPVGNKYAGTAANGGPSNAATSNNLAHADSWQRVFPERKQIKIARLVTRES